MSEPIARRELAVKMTVTADASNASKAMQALAADTKKVEEAASKANQALGGGQPGGGNAKKGLTFTEAAKDLTKDYGGKMLFGAAVLATVSGLSKAIQELDSSFLTAREKAVGFAQAIPLVGGAISTLMNSIIDAKERIFDWEQSKRVADMRHEQPILLGQRQAFADYGMRRYGLEREVRDAGFQSRAVGEFPTIASQQALLTSGVGGVAGAFLGSAVEAIDPRLLGGLEGIQAARRQARAAELAAGASQADVDAARPGAGRAMREYRAAVAESRDRLDAAREGLGGKGSNLSLTEAVLIEQRKLQQATIAQQELEAKITANKERQLDLVRKQHEVARAETNLMKTRVQILDEQYAKAKAGQRQFGLMDAVEQDALLRVAQRFKNFGREGITQDELSLLTGSDLTREFVGKRAEADNANNPVFQALLQLTGQRDAADLKAERDKLKAEVDMKIQFDEEQFAKLMEEKLKKINLKDLLGEIVKNQLEINLRRPELDALRAKVERGG